MGQIAHIPAGEDVVLNFSYIPSYVGDNTLTLWTHQNKGTQITGSGTVSIGTLIIDNNGSNNTDLIGKNDGSTTNVKLAGRTLYKDGKWNTLCLPFNLTIAGSPLEGATAMTLDVESMESDGVTYKTRFDNDGTLYLNFVSTSTLTAGTPYIIKWDKAEGYDKASEDTRDITEPVFTGVTLNKNFNDIESNDGKVQFLGRYAAKTYTAEEKSILLMGAYNTLYYPQPDLTDPENPKYPSIGACRAYFELVDPTQLARAFVLNFGDGDQSSGITESEVNSSFFTPHSSSQVWYTLDGRRLDAAPTAKGLYIHGGKKVVVK